MKYSEIGFGLAVMAVALFVLSGCLPGINSKAAMTKDVSNTRQIVLACKVYGGDWDIYPVADMSVENGKKFTTSTEAFNELIRHDGGIPEVLFHVPQRSDKTTPPNEDGTLTTDENCHSYISGQADSSHPNSPLVADEMESPGVFGKNHPWLKQGKAVIGYVDGQVSLEDLNQKSAGAVVQGPAGSGIDDIFQERTEDEEGRILGGLLSVPREKILQP